MSDSPYKRKPGRPPKYLSSKIRYYQKEPWAWIYDTFGNKLWEKQIEIFDSVWNNRYTAVKSCFASGKSHVSAAIAMAWLHLWRDSAVVTTGPSNRQVRWGVWSVMHQLHEKARAPLGSTMLQQSIRLGPGWEGVGYSTDEESNIQGLHPSSGRLLLIVDESAAVADNIHNRLTEALMTSEFSHRLDIGNPLDPGGKFFEMFTDDDRYGYYNRFTISAFDTPNLKAGKSVIPGLVTPVWVEERRKEWGEDSPMWKSRVLGEFPPSAEDSLIPMTWVMLAQERWEELESELVRKHVQISHGLDVARGGEAESALCSRVGRYVYPLRTWVGASVPETARKAHGIVHPSESIFVDDIGVGGGVTDVGREIGASMVPVNVSTSASDPDRFANLRAELYWKLRQALDPANPNAIGLPPDTVLAGQLTSLKYSIDGKGRIKMESKEDMRKKGIKSPDRADALMLTFAGHSYGGNVLPISVGVGRSSYWEDVY